MKIILFSILACIFVPSLQAAPSPITYKVRLANRADRYYQIVVPERGPGGSIFSLDRASHEHCALAPKALQDLLDELEATRQPRNRCCACNLDSSESIRSLAA